MNLLRALAAVSAPFALVVAAQAQYFVTYDVALAADIDFNSGLIHENTFGITTPLSFSGSTGDLVSFYDVFPKPLPPAATFLGLITDSLGDDHVAYFMNEAATLGALGQSFESVFQTYDSNHNLVAAQESDIVAALHNIYVPDSDPNADALHNAGLDVIFPFLEANDGKNVAVGTLSALGPSGSLVEFSTGTVVGTGTVTAVPEPASMAALGVGALGLLRRRRKA